MRDAPNPAAVVLSCSALTVGYGSREVLGELSLEFRAGQWSAVVGPNGCGKSTLLRALAGLAHPFSGAVTLQGKPLSSWPRRERARRLAWLAQASGNTELTAADVVNLGRFAHAGWLASRQAQDTEAVNHAMAATGSLEWAHRRVSSLSGGERQRVYLARALAVEAAVLLLDEPTTHLDPPHQEDVIRLLKALAAQRNVCVVSAIHDLSLALAADSLVVIGPHGLIGHGTVQEALDNDWLSKAFDTVIHIVDCDGTPVWRPSLTTQRD